MNLVIPIVVFFGSALWGTFGEIPFTGIQPSSSFAQRTLSSLQLAGSAYALSELLPANTTSGILSTPNPPKSIYTYTATGILDTSNIGNDSFFATETCAPKHRSTPSTPGTPKSEQERFFEKVVLVLMTVNFGILIKLLLYHHEDRVREVQFHYDQREYMHELLFTSANNYLPQIVKNWFEIHMEIWEQNAQLEAIQGSIQRLHTKFERFDSNLKQLEELTDQDRLDKAMARWQEFHEQLKKFPWETAKAFRVIVKTLEASLESSEADDAGLEED